MSVREKNSSLHRMVSKENLINNSSVKAPSINIKLYLKTQNPWCTFFLILNIKYVTLI